MRDVKYLNDVVNSALNGIIHGMEQAVHQASVDMAQEVRSRVNLPPEATWFPTTDYKYDNVSQYSTYVPSIKNIPVEWKGYTCYGGVHSDYMVSWDRVGKVPFGVFIEWGTGPVGMRTVKDNKGYPYSIIVPWDNATNQQCNMYNEWGLSAQPHWYPALRSYAPKVKPLLVAKIKENIIGLN